MAWIEWLVLGRFWGLENRITPIATSPILSRIPKNDIRLVNTISANVIYCCSVCLCTMSLHHEMRYSVRVDDLWCSASTQYMAIVYKCAINYMQHSVYTIRITPCFEFIFSSAGPWILPTLPLPSLESNLPPWFGSLPPSLLPIAPWDLPGGKSPGSRCDTWKFHKKGGGGRTKYKKCHHLMRINAFSNPKIIKSNGRFTEICMVKQCKNDDFQTLLSNVLSPNGIFPTLSAFPLSC